MAEFFPYELDGRFAVPLLAVGVRPGRDGVTLTDDGRFRAGFGLFKVETPLANIAGAHVTGPYRWWTAVGPRASMADDGLTFGTTNRRGVCVHFHERIHRVVGFQDHSALTVTVADPEALVAALAWEGQVRPSRSDPS